MEFELIKFVKNISEMYLQRNVSMYILDLVVQDKKKLKCWIASVEGFARESNPGV